MDVRPEPDTIDAAICMVLQQRPHATTAELSRLVAASSDAEVTDSLRRLRAAGLVHQVDESPPRYAVRVSPEDAARTLTRRSRARRQPAASVRCHTTQRSAASGAPEVLVGPEETRRAAVALQRRAKSEVLLVDRPPYACDFYRDPVEREQLGKGVQYRVVYDRSALTLPGRLENISELVRLGETARTAPAVPMKMLIADRAVAVIPLQVSQHAVERALLVRQSSLLAALLRIFAQVWRSAVPLGPDHVTANAAAAFATEEPTLEERQILALLAAGATDESIGRLMGFSPRTAHRRVRDLTAKLGVRTRFQAGVQAVRLGWL